MYYTPETRFSIGAAGIYAFRFRSDSSNARPSRINFGLAVTQNRQLLVYLPFQLFPQNGRFTIYGEAGWYRYNYYFFGVGNTQPQDYRERYAVDYPRFRINALRKLGKGFYAGFRYWYEDWKLSELDPAGQLAQGAVRGSNGGAVSGPGFVVNYDTRDNIFYPQRGVLIESAIQFFDKNTGSDFSFTRTLLDAATYVRPTKTAVVAVNAIADLNTGTPPFYLMALMGGTKRMRGFYEGRFRDNNLILFQTEWRQHIWKRFGAVAFGGTGIVADKISHLRIADTRFTYGLGLRFTLDKKEHINIRLDYGRGTYNSAGFYLTIGEAF
ncbi:MAG: BamA/TamA family outer membrane protein [Bacteroidetes bacterium]|nr:BamA/TamA family outer membrane protein [Bacteroidota bacterium]